MTRAPVIYVDVDDTLVRSFGPKRIVISRSVALVRELHRAGAELYCWSRGGAGYARETVRQLGLEQCFRACVAKPDALLDDTELNRWQLLEVHPNSAPTAEEMIARLG